MSGLSSVLRVFVSGGALAVGLAASTYYALVFRGAVQEFIEERIYGSPRDALTLYIHTHSHGPGILVKNDTENTETSMETSDDEEDEGLGAIQ